MNTDNLIKLRKDLGLTQEEMGIIVGVKRSSYACYESNIKLIPLDKLNIISNKYNKSLNFLTGYSRTDNIKFKPIDIDKIKIGEILKLERKKLGITQKELAKRINSSQARVCGYEKGIGISILTLIEYAKITNKSIDYLCGKADK